MNTFLGDLALALGNDTEDIELSELGDAELVELLGKVKKIKNPTKKAKATKKVKVAMKQKISNKQEKNIKSMAAETREMSFKTLFANRIKLLPSQVQKLILSGKWQVVDKVLYSTKYIGGKTSIDMFESGDKKREGQTNMVQARLGATENFLVCAIRVLTATDEKYTADNFETEGVCADFGKCCSEVSNGNYQLLNEQTNYSDENSALVFRHDRTDVLPGIYFLENPKMFMANKSIKLNFKFAGQAKAGTVMRVELLGAMTVQA